VKFGKTLILLAVFGALLAFVLIFESRGKKAEERKQKEGSLVDIAAADIRKMELETGGGIITFTKDDKGEWLIAGPIQSKADAAEVNALADGFSRLKFERVVEAEPADVKTYEIPTRKLTLWVKGDDRPVRLFFGMENPIDKTLFAQREGEKRVVLLASSLKSPLEKKLFDFRDKAVFKLDTAQVASIRVTAGKVAWEAVRKDETWNLSLPVTALADRTKVGGLVDAISGLRATEFVSETGTAADLLKFGLDKPDYEIRLALPGANTQALIQLRKEGDKVYASGSLTDKIILVENRILTDLDRKPEEYREKKVAAFASWDADRIAIAAGSLSLAAVKEKAGDLEKWRLETPDKPDADGSKIETFIRKIEGLEALEFIDAPESLAEFGLDRPSAEVKIRTKDYQGNVREATVLVGREDKDTKRVVVKNAALPYLFRVDGAFLQEMPKDLKDWKAPEETTERDAKKAP